MWAGSEKGVRQAFADEPPLRRWSDKPAEEVAGTESAEAHGPQPAGRTANERKSLALPGLHTASHFPGPPAFSTPCLQPQSPHHPLTLPP